MLKLGWYSDPPFSTSPVSSVNANLNNRKKNVDAHKHNTKQNDEIIILNMADYRIIN